MSQFQTFHVERVSNTNCFNIDYEVKNLKNITVETVQHWQTLMIENIVFQCKANTIHNFRQNVLAVGIMR